MAEGYISLYRKFLSWEWFDDEKAVKLFIYLLLKANWKPKRWRGQLVERGQLITSTVKLSEETRISKSTINRLLVKLQMSGELVRKADNKKTVITICNYDRYQIVRSDNESLSEIKADNKKEEKRISDGQQADTTNKENNINNNKTIKGRGQKFVPPTDPDFFTYLSEFLESKKIKVSAEQLAGILENFRDHYEAVGWQVGKNKMVDWKAAARNSIKWEKNQNILNGETQKGTSQGIKFPNFYDAAFVSRYCQDPAVWTAYKKHLIALGFESITGPGGTTWRKKK